METVANYYDIREAGRQGYDSGRDERKGAGILGGKTSAMSYSAEQKRQIQWLSLSLT